MRSGADRRGNEKESMTDNQQIIDFFREEYAREAQKKEKKPQKAGSLGEKVQRLSSSMRRANPSRMGLSSMEEIHRQILNLAKAARRTKNENVSRQIFDRLIPELVRLDVGMLMPEQEDGMDEDFFDYLRYECPGQITQKCLFVLYPAYREKIIRRQMKELVPVRPELEFPEVLHMKRKFILHIGPTNSGKTYQALERLKTAKSGVYLGPLRLLALEVYETLHDQGVPSVMLTGQECIEDENARITAATVEMADLDLHYQIAVIDEAQLVADPDRGHSWTRAILGLMADEIHICAAPSALDVLIHLIETCNDTWEVRRYERKTDLVFEDRPFSFPEDVQDGDALIVFSKKSVLDVAGRLEEYGMNASVIYGSLPPEIRRRQMHLFTEGSTKTVVSTDAIGMGLNLPVRRIVFLQCAKYDGTQSRLLTTSEIRQIAGRAGRYGIYDTGYITAADQESLDYIRNTYYKDEPDVDRVIIGFPQVLLDIDEPLDQILKVWHDQKIDPPFRKENVDEMLFLYEKAKAVRERIPEFEDKHVLYRMISTPVDIKDRHVVSLWLRYCTDYMADVSLEKPSILRKEKNSLLKYETYYKQLDLYYQMSYRLGKERDEKWVARERERTEEKIMRYLLRDKVAYIKRCRYCGRMLPIESPFNCCDRCFYQRR